MGLGVFESADVDEVEDVEGCDGVDGLHVHEASDEESEEVAVLSGSFEGLVELFVGGLEEGCGRRGLGRPGSLTMRISGSAKRMKSPAVGRNAAWFPWTFRRWVA